ncbi:DUF1835 domain-containing protein [Mucilaginibacter sp. KACC 22063]|uniref:DUF1835 domain-containing protein n=1 Tax=Mucilaginibacter sp. KACC 22063 TaxID=3025666 RepID=UPI00236719D7|nr:DUF1835 domain-containing protein [Mucilaginibacter sp. KACC 22063]WDF55524.1 DUF1835 domain-containing protein [Mucilaginibacter sp. KACC 22063]
MPAILHILNGDATLNSFNETGLDGDALVWREVLSEGPLTKKIDKAFWEQRAAWISKTFNDTPEHYMQWVVGELEKLNNDYEEINLWFEFDLHCQVNLLGVMQLLKQQTDLTVPNVFLICPESYPGMEDFRGMGQLNGSQLEDVFDDRVQLTEYDFTLADEAWNIYVSGDKAAIASWVESVPFWGSLSLLKPAMQAHLKRLETNENGLNYIEQKLLKIYHTGKTSRSDIHQQFWADDKIYGMGDAELNIYLNRLAEKGLASIS